MPLLSHKICGEGWPVFILHGLMGNKDNLLFLESGLEIPLQRIYLDLRNHGDSFHSPGMDYPLMAEDVLHLADYLQLDQFYLIGHSMGAKTAMEIALEAPDRVEKLVILDMIPRGLPVRYESYLEVMEQVQNQGLPDRKSLRNYLEGALDQEAPIPFLLKNFPTHPPFRCRLGLEGIKNNLEKIFAPVGGNRTYSGETLFILGNNSFIKDYFTKEDIQKLFPAGQTTWLPGGHLIHLEAKDQVLAEINSFLS